MTAIEIIWLGENLLTGPLPATWGSWKAVQQIAVESNRHVGTVPSTWGALGKSLNGLWLSNNPDLTGCLPRGLERFKGNRVDVCDGTGLTCDIC